MPTMVDVLASGFRSGARVDRTKLAPGSALRVTLGLAVPLVAGALTGHLLSGVSAAVGALTAGFAALQGTYRTRAGIVLLAAGGTALSAFIGGLVGHLEGVDVVVTAAWGLGAGLLVAFGQAATVVGLQSVVGLVVFAQFHFTVTQALVQAGLILGGGLVQILLVVVLWPLRRFTAERQALGGAYEQLARYARSIVTSSATLPDPAGFGGLEAPFRDPQPLGSQTDMAAYQALVNQGERLRLELAALSQWRQRLSAAGDRRPVPPLDALLTSAAGILAEVADALRSARAPGVPEDAWAELQGALGELRGAGGSPQLAGPDGWGRALLDEAATSAQALAGQLRAVVRLAAVPAGDNSEPLEGPTQTGVAAPPVFRRRPLIDLRLAREGLGVLRANLTPTSEVGRHALRLALALAVAVALSHLFPLGHAYWLALTVMIVLKPDFQSTFTRGLARVAGTLVGAGLVTLVVASLRPGPAVLIALVLALYWAALTVMLANYAIFSACVSSLVVVLLAFTGAPEVSLAADRSVYTAMGAGLAILAYLVWPTWAQTLVGDRLAIAFEVEGRYGSAVLRAWADPPAADPVALQRARMTARRARSDAEGAVSRWLAEPARAGTPQPGAVKGAMAALRRYAQGVLALHAAFRSDGRPHPEVAPLAAEVGQALDALAGVLRSGEGAAGLPPLRATQVRLSEQLGVGPAHAESRDPLDTHAVVLSTETDLIVNALDTVGHLFGLDGSHPGQ